MSTSQPPPVPPSSPFDFSADDKPKGTAPSSVDDEPPVPVLNLLPALAYAASFFLAFDTNGGWTGWTFFVQGFNILAGVIAVAGGGGNPTVLYFGACWLAYPVFALGWLALILGRGRLALYLAVLALGLATAAPLIVLTNVGLPLNVREIGVGYWVWLGSFAILGVAGVLSDLWERDGTERPRKPD
jgi:hypothetical protein